MEKVIDTIDAPAKRRKFVKLKDNTYQVSPFHLFARFQELQHKLFLASIIRDSQIRMDEDYFPLDSFITEANKSIEALLDKWPV